MEPFKIDNFHRENPRGAFPWFKSLDRDACASIRKRLAERLEVPVCDDPLALIKILSKKASSIGRMGPEGDKLDLRAVLERQGIKPLDLIYINWYRFDAIDQMRLSELLQHLDAIWYPGADDIDIFDDSLDWILSITHYGAVALAKLKPPLRSDP